MSFICGSFRSQDEDNYDVIWPFSSTSPRKPTRKRKLFGSRRDNKTATNPYSDRGLDKFEALLADLDQRRQKIFTQKGSEDVSMVKFIYRGPNEVQPIVVKLRDQRKQLDNMSVLNTREPDHQKDTKPVVDKPAEKIWIDQCCKEHKRRFADWWNPSYYLPLFVIMILVFLMFFGRSVAILCISTCWYLVPNVNKIIHSLKQTKNVTKKVHLKRSRWADKHQ
ncbi:hypothetical protein SSX86_014110 [Deinandra increscens subsp. villosa]|uniref:ZCF37 n=1 Tax=Deinandra increscens subsp. villosa TaxID=3103831 RepID=A0AAP0D5T5_9ASTR